MGWSGSKRWNKHVWKIGIEEWLFRENQAKDCQEIQELRRICCQETDRAGQASVDELSLHQEVNPPAVSWLLTQIQDLQSKVIPGQTRESFRILKQRAALERPTFRVNLPPSPKTMPCRDSGLPYDTRNIVGTSGNVSERLPAREGRTPTLW